MPGAWMTRRDLLLGSGTCSLLAQAPPQITVAQNLSYPLSSVVGRVTPADMFFVRDHFHEPILSIRSWRLRVEGRVARPLDLSFSDLIEAPGTSIESVLECAGNVAGGSAVSNGTWSGV